MGKVIGIVLLLLAALLLAALNFFFNFAHRRRRPKRQKKPVPPANEAERRFQEMVAEGRAWVEGHGFAGYRMAAEHLLALQRGVIAGASSRVEITVE